MDAVFLKLFNMSVAASWLILAVIMLRLLLRKGPRWPLCALWAIVAVRLICPFSFESSLSLIPSAETLSTTAVRYAQEPAIDSGVLFIDSTLNPIISESFAPAPGASVNPLYIWMSVAGVVWGIGLIGMLGYALVSFLRIRGKVREAIPLRDNIWLCDAVKSPFILGVLRPRIYLPSGTEEAQMKYILVHEQAHLKRGDHWWKPLGYLLVAVYWFNPLVWLAYILLCRDIEIACDEKAIKEMNLSEKKAYSDALVSCSTQRRIIMACPLAFGEVGVKERVTKVLSYKKPAFWVIMAAIAVCVVMAVCFLTNPRNDTFDIKIVVPAGGEQTFYYSEEEISPTGKTITLSSGEGLGDSPGNQGGQDLDAAISAAILEQNASRYLDSFDIACCDFVTLEELSVTPAAGNKTHTIVLYGWVLYQQYAIDEEGIKDLAGSHIPVALTFELDEKGYQLKEYWQPREGSYYVPDVRSKFPSHIADDGLDSQKYIIRQIQSCYRQAVEFSGLDTDAVVGNLLDTICSSPATSSNPQDYIGAHFLEYRELLYYGGFTLQYCFERFDNGNETGLEGKIMAVVCEELLQTKGTLPVDAGTAETGQFWYDTLLAHASNMVEPYLDLNEKYDMFAH